MTIEFGSRASLAGDQSGNYCRDDRRLEVRSPALSESGSRPRSTNRLDEASLERAVRDSEALAKISPENPE